MRIAFFELEPWEKDYIQKQLKGHTVLFFMHPLHQKDINSIKNVECLCPHVYSDCSAKILRQLPKLKYIATISTGYDHIDLSYCKQKGITVMNVPSYGENTVAEFSFALLLALTRKLYPSIKRVKEENTFSCLSLTGTDLKGKTIGIIGTGNIGKYVIRLAHGFNMKILACCHHPDMTLSKCYGVKYVDFPTLLKKADIVTLHIPYRPENHHLLNKKTFRMMKKGALLINTARGGLVDTDALYHALKTKHLGGAALDVLEMECEVKEEKQLLSKQFPATCNLKTLLETHQLMTMENVLITPHNAWHTKEALLRILDTALQNISSCKKKRQRNRVVYKFYSIPKLSNNSSTTKP